MFFTSGKGSCRYGYLVNVSLHVSQLLPVYLGKTSDKVGAIASFELLESAAICQTTNDLDGQTTKIRQHRMHESSVLGTFVMFLTQTLYLIVF